MLLPIPHRQQEQQADCLAACAAMVLQYLHTPFDYNRLRRNIIYLNDPSFAEAPQSVAVDAFLAAWSGFAYLHALIGLA